MDAEASAFPKVNKDQDEEATSDPEGLEYLYANSIFIPEVTEDCEWKVAGALDEVNTQKTPGSDRPMDFDVSNIYKNDKIHGVQSTRQLMNLTLERLRYFSEPLSIFLKSIQTSHKNIYLISRGIKNCIGRNSICAGGEEWL